MVSLSQFCVLFFQLSFRFLQPSLALHVSIYREPTKPNFFEQFSKSKTSFFQCQKEKTSRGGSEFITRLLVRTPFLFVHPELSSSLPVSGDLLKKSDVEDAAINFLPHEATSLSCAIAAAVGDTVFLIIIRVVLISFALLG